MKTWLGLHGPYDVKIPDVILVNCLHGPFFMGNISFCNTMAESVVVQLVAQICTGALLVSGFGNAVFGNI